MSTKNKTKTKSKKTRVISSSILKSRSTYKNTKTKNTKNIKTTKNTKTKNTKQINNILNNDNLKNNELKSFTIRFSSRRFYSKTHTARRVKRIPFHKDLLVQFIDDNHMNLKHGKIFKNTILDKYIFKDDPENCICDNMFKKHLKDDCKCDNMKTYSSQGKSGASIHSIRCIQIQNVLKVVPLSTYYMKMRTQTNKYIFIEFDGFTIQTLINTYVHKELPNNTVNIVNSGACRKTKNSKYNGYNLMEEADLGSGRHFFNKLLDGILDNDFNINSEDMRYKAVTNFLLQVVLIIGHLQSSSLEFFHGDYKPENVFVKTSNPKILKKFKFNVFGKDIYIKNMGFSVLIADFDRSSISLNSDYTDKKYRIISPILFKPLLTNYVNKIIKKYGDIDPDTFEGEIKVVKFFISKLIPITKDPTITILRSAGIKVFRDFDLYTFFIKLLDTSKVRDYIILKKLDKTILSFMSEKFKNNILTTAPKILSLNESAYIAVNILHKIKEPMNNVFTEDYLKTLNILNYRLFR